MTGGGIDDRGKFFIEKVFMSCTVRREHFQHVFLREYGFCISGDMELLAKATIFEAGGGVTTKRRQSACLRRLAPATRTPYSMGRQKRMNK